MDTRVTSNIIPKRVCDEVRILTWVTELHTTLSQSIESLFGSLLDGRVGVVVFVHTERGPDLDHRGEECSSFDLGQNHTPHVILSLSLLWFFLRGFRLSLVSNVFIFKVIISLSEPLNRLPLSSRLDNLLDPHAHLLLLFGREVFICSGHLKQCEYFVFVFRDSSILVLGHDVIHFLFELIHKLFLRLVSLIDTSSLKSL